MASGYWLIVEYHDIVDTFLYHDLVDTFFIITF